MKVDCGNGSASAQIQAATVFGRLAAWILRYPRAWALALALSAVLGAWITRQLGVDSDMLKLLPADDPSVIALQELDQQEGGVNLLTISVSGPDQPTVDTFLEDLQARVQAIPEVRYSIFRLPPELMLRIAVLQLTPQELATIKGRVQAAIALGPATNPFISGRVFDLGTLSKKLATPTDKLSLSATPNTGRLLVRPDGSSHDVPFARRLMTAVHKAIDDADPEARGVKVTWIGGPYRHTIEDVDGVAYDIGWTTLPCFLLISLAILVAFRDWRPVVVIIIPQMVAALWSMSFAWLAIGSLNMFTSFAVAVLVGLGNDYGIMHYSRYRERRAIGLSVDQSIVDAWDLAAGPSLTCALTAAAGFLALLAATFQGFRQLGIVIGAGIPLCFLAVVLIQPLLIRWTNPPARATLVQSWSSERTKFSNGLSIPVLMVGILLTVIAAWAMTHMPFDYDLSSLRRQGMAFSELDPAEQKLAQDSYSPIIVNYSDEALMNADYDRINKEIADGTFPEVSRVLSIRSVIPADMEERARSLQELALLAENPNVVYLPELVRRNLVQLAAISKGDGFVLRVEDLPVSLLSLLGAGTGHHRMMVSPTGNMWDLRSCAALGVAMREHLPGRAIAGEYISLGTLYTLIRSDAPRIIAVAFLLVTILLFLDLKSVTRTTWAMYVQVSGMICSAGVLVLFNLELNLVNFVAIPILVGTGIEAAIYLLHRLKEEGRGGIVRTMLTSGLASSLCTITTLLAFASLLFASSRGVRSLGQVIVAGDATMALVTFLLLPAGSAFHWWWQDQRKKS